MSDLNVDYIIKKYIEKEEIKPKRKQRKMITIRDTDTFIRATLILLYDLERLPLKEINKIAASADGDIQKVYAFLVKKIKEKYVIKIKKGIILDQYEMFKYNCYDPRTPVASAVMAYAEKTWLDIRVRGYV